jgi:hypothetical protein
MLTHDEIRTAAIATMKADASVNSVIKGWYRYLLPIGNIRCPAFYIGEIIQPFSGGMGKSQQYTTLANPMDITAGVLCEGHDKDDVDVELGTTYELVYNAFKATPTLGLDNFGIHNILPITTKPMPEHGKFTIGAEIILNAVWEE